MKVWGREDYIMTYSTGLIAQWFLNLLFELPTTCFSTLNVIDKGDGSI